jgi:hypothetical protein
MTLQNILLRSLLIAAAIMLSSSFIANNRAFSTSSLIVFATKGKGFGKKDPLPEVEEPIIVPDEYQTSKPASSKPLGELKAPDNMYEAMSNTDMFQKERAKRLKNIKEKRTILEEEEALIASDPSVGAVPELIADRMIRRIAFFFGIPVFGGLAIFVAAFFISKKYDIVVPPPMVAYATQVPFVAGLLGITYGILSSSWDEEPGSMFGIKEFKTNVDRIKEGLQRSRDTARLQDEIEKDEKNLF